MLNPLVAMHRPLMGLRRVYPLIAVTSAGATTSQVTRQFNVLVHKTHSIPFLSISSCSAFAYGTLCAFWICLSVTARSVMFPGAGYPRMFELGTPNGFI
jgi:hypothetical protein